MAIPGKKNPVLRLFTGKSGKKGGSAPPPQPQPQVEVPYHHTQAAAWKPYPGHQPPGERVGEPQYLTDLISEDYPQYLKETDTLVWNNVPGTHRE
ncbi:hypothetical protein MCOR25_005519 [Pyricularia grisea]|nr:hypothetical protein MCOR25_005519 [Pyricularia grisea]